MKVVILAGGLGTRLSEETSVKPKPMVEIGDRPILEHILGLYDAYGHKEFVIALGYLGHIIKRFVVDRATLSGDLHVDLSTSVIGRQVPNSGDWKISLVDSGERPPTRGRHNGVRPYLRPETFMLTYGDGLSNVDLDALVAFHRGHGKLATVTAVHPPARFGEMELDGERIVAFSEKPQVKQGWINGGFMVFEPAVLDWIEDDDTVLERDVLTPLAEAGQLMAFRHAGFW